MPRAPNATSKPTSACCLHANPQARGMLRFEQKQKRAERDASAETTIAPGPTARLHLGR
jgi:hypothetical protein